MRVTVGRTDGQTEFSSLYGVCIACSAVKIGYFAPTRSIWSKISARRGRFPPIIFARIVRTINALQLCFWQFSHRCYGWGATGQIDWKSAISLQRGHFDPKFQVQWVASTNHFARLVRPMNTLQLCRWQFSHKETFFKRSAILHGNRPFCVFETPFRGLRGNVRRSS